MAACRIKWHHRAFLCSPVCYPRIQWDFVTQVWVAGASCRRPTSHLTRRRCARLPMVLLTWVHGKSLAKNRSRLSPCDHLMSSPPPLIAPPACADGHARSNDALYGVCDPLCAGHGATRELYAGFHDSWGRCHARRAHAVPRAVNMFEPSGTHVTRGHVDVHAFAWSLPHRCSR